MEHSYQVSECTGLPHGVVSEGPAEAAHLQRKNARLGHTRKSDPKKHMHDLHSWDMCRSDPLIAKIASKIASQYRQSEVDSVLALPAKARELLDIPIQILEQVRALETSSDDDSE